MSPSVDGAAVQELRDLAIRRFGLRFGDDKQDFLADTLRQRMESTRTPSVSEYLRRLDLPGDANELHALAAALTVTETFFFRGADQLRAFREGVIPDRLSLRSTTRELRILSAGCATGEEPYTLAMILSDAFPDLAAWKITLLGIDLNPRNLAHAARARYTAWSLRETPDSSRDRYFRREGSEFVVHDAYRRMATFREVNLSQPPVDVFPGEFYDVVFCRNVLMYFTPDVMRDVVDRIARSLVPGGYLFLGHAETLRGVSPDFSLCHTHGTFYYQRRGGIAPRGMETPAPAIIEEPSPPEPDAGWMQSIRESSERMESLTRDLGSPSPPTALPAAQGGLPLAVEYLRQERFQEALNVVAPVLAGTPKDIDALLLQAVLLTHCGRPAQAEAVCESILRADDLNAEAHHLIAICREHAGDLAAAIEQDQMAQYLDPAFAMPYVHVGRLARRKGDLALARRQLEQALGLLVREESSRILLFGGGFGREALMQLCRGELQACGGRP